MDRRGPKVGDAASLWNFTPSPGWSKEESLILKVCLMKFGIGQWSQIQSIGLLPGKLIQQLNGATQRLLGQQSLAAFSGLKLDVDRIRADNEGKTDSLRKNGLIIWSGPNPTKEMKLHWQQVAKEQYSLSPEQQQEVDAAFAQLTAATTAAADSAADPRRSLPPAIDVLGCDTDKLSICQKQLLVCHLQWRLLQVLDEAVQQQPNLARLVTYQQQQQQLSSSWIVHGVQRVTGAAASRDGNCKMTDETSANAPALAGAEGPGTAFSQPLNAPLLVRQTGTAAAVKSSKQGSCRGSCTANKNRSKTVRRSDSTTTRRKRSRSDCDTAAGDEPAADGEAAFLQWVQQRRGSGSSGSRGRGGSNSSSNNGGGGGSTLFVEMMQATLDAGVAQLTEMGYSRSKALDAMRECGCDVEAAVEYLATSCC